MGVLDSIKGLLGGNKDKVDQGVEKAGDMVDDKTGGKHVDKVDMAQDKASEHIDKLTDEK